MLNNQVLILILNQQPERLSKTLRNEKNDQHWQQFIFEKIEMGNKICHKWKVQHSLDNLGHTPIKIHNLLLEDIWTVHVESKVSNLITLWIIILMCINRFYTVLHEESLYVLNDHNYHCMSFIL